MKVEPNTQASVHDRDINWKLIGVILVAIFVFVVGYLYLEIILSDTLHWIFSNILALTVVYFIVQFSVLVSEPKHHSQQDMERTGRLFRIHLFGPIGDDFLYSVTPVSVFYAVLTSVKVIILHSNSLDISSGDEILTLLVLGGVIFWLFSRTSILFYRVVLQHREEEPQDSTEKPKK